MENRAALGVLERPAIASPPIPSSPSQAAEATPRAARRPWRERPVPTVAFGLLAFVIYLIAGQILPAVLSIIEHGGPRGDGIELILAASLGRTQCYGAALCALLVYACARFGLLADEPPKLPLRRQAAWVLGLGCCAFFGQIALSLLLSALGQVPAEQPMIIAAARSGGLGFLLGLAVAAPLAEELIFRRLLFPNIARGAGRLTAYVVTVGLFGLIHLNPSALLIYIWLGCCFTYAYERTGSWRCAFAVHALNNTVAGLAMLYGAA